jgi:hypothetical protein
LQYGSLSRSALPPDATLERPRLRGFSPRGAALPAVRVFHLAAARSPLRFSLLQVVNHRLQPWFPKAIHPQRFLPGPFTLNPFGRSRRIAAAG